MAFVTTCPECGEECYGAVFSCPACSASLETEDELKTRKKHERGLRLEKMSDDFVRVLPLGAVFLLVASGYSRKSRLTLIGLGLGMLVAACAWIKRKNASRAAHENIEKPPVERLTHAIFLYAVRDGASQIRLRAGVGVAVHYLIGDKWKEQMKIPAHAFAWADLRDHLKEQSDNWKQPILLEMNGKRCQYTPRFERDFPLETLTLSKL